MEFSYSFLSCRESSIDIFRVIEGNKCKLAIIFGVLLNNYGRNFTILPKNLSKLGFIP